MVSAFSGIDSSVSILYVSGLIALNLPTLVQLIQPEDSCLPTWRIQRLMWHESVGVHSDYASLIAYTSKNYNYANFTPVYIISSEHVYNITFEGQKHKPAPMWMNNMNKKGVDKGNQMLAHNSVYRESPRWTYRIFCNYLDIAALNSWVIARHTNTDLQYPVRKSGRRRMLKELALQLGKDCVQIRSQINNLPRQIRSDLNALGHQRQRLHAVPIIQRRRGRYELCTVRLRKTTHKTCSLCRRFVLPGSFCEYNCKLWISALTFWF